VRAAIVDPLAHRIMDAIYRFGGARFSDLRRVVGNPRTLSRKLAALMELGLVERRGRLYGLTERGIEVLGLLSRALELIGEPQPRIDVDRIPHRVYAPLIERYVRMLLERYSERLLGVVLFGSVARGDWRRDSDIDLMVVVDGWEGKPVWERLRELYEVRERLRGTEEYRRALKAGYIPVIQHYPLSRGEALKFRMAYLDVLLDGIVVYERGGFVSEVFRSLRERLSRQGAVRVQRPDGSHYWVLEGGCWRGRQGV